MPRSSGFSLPELMVSLFLGSLLLLLMMTLLIQFKTNFQQEQRALERAMDEDWILDSLRAAAWNAGFTPCGRLSQLLSQDAETHLSLNAYLAEAQAKKISFFRMADLFTEAVEFKNSYEILYHGTLHLKPGQQILIADCRHAELHRIAESKAARGGGSLKLQEPLIYRYPKKSYLGRWHRQSWQLRKTPEGKAFLAMGSASLQPITDYISSFHFETHQQGQETYLTVVLNQGEKGELTLEVRLRNA